MMSVFGDHIRVTSDGHVALVTFARPPNNHVSVELVQGLADALDAIDQEPTLRAVVLQAEGKNFCAGADLLSTAGVAASGMAGVYPLYAEATRLFASHKPIVAAVQGAAVGAGLGLALAADFRVASPDARFSANFVKLAFHPGFGITHTLPRVVGASKAALMCLTGRRVKADDALSWGLVDDVVPLESLRAAALRLAAEIAENGPLALEATRKTLRGDLAEAVRAATDSEFQEQSLLRGTEDFEEGVQAVAERRIGRFEGR
jgi:enoyl-CoA hydratase/carnithine racemase